MYLDSRQLKKDKKQDRWSVRRQTPNALTISRVLFAVALLWLYWAGAAYAWLLIVFLAGSLTDWLDGTLARRWRVESDFGKLVDPLADKILTWSAYFVLASVYQSLWLDWLFVLMVIREVATTNFKFYVQSHGRTIGAVVSAKWKTTVQVFLVAALFVNLIMPGSALIELSVALGMAAFILAYWSGFYYARVLWEVFQKQNKKWSTLLLTVGFAGSMPKAAGTWTAFIWTFGAALLYHIWPFGPVYLAVLAVLAAIWMLIEGTKRTKRDVMPPYDKGWITLDELAGLMIALLPFWLKPEFSWFYLLVGLALFRLFDIAKPKWLGIKQVDRSGTPASVFWDDIMAGAYAALLAAALQYLISGSL